MWLLFENIEQVQNENNNAGTQPRSESLFCLSTGEGETLVWSGFVFPKYGACIENKTLMGGAAK